MRNDNGTIHSHDITRENVGAKYEYIIYLRVSYPLPKIDSAANGNACATPLSNVF